VSRPVALVTGASSGVGRACALGLAERGFDLAVAARRSDELDALARQLGDSCRVMIRCVDLHDPEETARVVPEVVDEFGRLDVLLNIAGIFDIAPLHEMSLGSLQRTLAINTIAPAILVREAWAALAAAPRGVVLNMSSLASIDPFPGAGAYGISKSAIEGLTRSVHVESLAAEAGIEAYSLAAGCIDTPMLRSVLGDIELPAGAEIPMDQFVGIAMDCIEGRRPEARGLPLFVVRDGFATLDSEEALEAIRVLWKA